MKKNKKEFDAKNIDSLEKIKKIDKENVLGSIEALPDQIRQAWQETKQLDFDLNQSIHNITVAGMGGSGLGADVVKHAFKNELEVPLNIVNSYLLPGYIKSDSLVILSSYSGNTEEVLSCAEQAQEKKAQILVITQGGKLAKIAQQNNYPTYMIKPDHNPSDQPRMAIGYAIVGLMGLLHQAECIQIKDTEIEQIVETVLTNMHQCSVDRKSDNNPAKTLSYTLIDRRPNIATAQFLNGAGHVASNQFNENAKTFANYYQIPEINHHLLEALQFPASNKLDNFFLFFNSDLYHEKNKQRMKLTQKAVEKQGMESLMINLKSDSKLDQIFELITLMAYANFYLSILQQINPSKIPMVDWFKEQLSN